MKGALLINLGSPDSPDPRDVKRYLGEFLMDEESLIFLRFLELFWLKASFLIPPKEIWVKAYKKFGGKKDLL